jgi:hypothetical protein
MRKFFYLFHCLFLCYSLAAKSPNQYFNFIDPLPGAKYINREACIIIKPGEQLQKYSLFDKKAYTLTGSISGPCQFNLIQSTDEKTIIIKPIQPFQFGENVKVEFTDNIKTTYGTGIKAFSFSFAIKSNEVKVNPQLNLASEFRSYKPPIPQWNEPQNDLIQVFPVIKVIYYSNPAQGRIFLSNFPFNLQIPNVPHLIILNNNAKPFHAIQMTTPCFDFNMQPNGHLTYFDPRYRKYVELDENYNLVDSFYCGNGYGTDLHELRVLPDRHALLMSYDSQHVDMSQVVPGGDPDAVVSGLIIQEIDESKNVVFQWRSWDHFQITDAWHENMLAHAIDAVHGNAIELDNDGNILISSRHLDEITKINRTTGEVIWRLGGKNNQFTFINDPLKFNYQHAIRRLNNGNIILFDNGNYHEPPFSRAVEYKLDEVNMTSKLVWQYRRSPDVYGLAMGFAQRLDNGNTLISWGAANPTITEVRPNGKKTLELSLPTGVFTYRAFKYLYKEDGTGKLIPEVMYLGQNFPNPFNPVTSIRFGIPRLNGNSTAVNGRLIVYDALGRQIAVLIDGDLEPDTYTVDFNAGELSSGIYFYTLYVSGGSAKYYESKKMLLVK